MSNGPCSSDGQTRFIDLHAKKMHDHASLVELVKIVKVAKTLTAQFSQIAQSILIDKVFSNGQTLS